MVNNRFKTLQRKIKLYYKKSGRVLPWRIKVGKNQEPYRTLISEIMLQQTRVNAVLDYYKVFLDKFPDIRSLALAKEEEVLITWSGLGYYRRAINLHRTAKIIVKDYDGIIPSDKGVLKNLPGIGEYTSSAIASFAFGREELAIDTNVERFIKRIFNIKDNNLNSNKTKELGYKLFPTKKRGDFSQAIMDFSNDFCIKLRPKCKTCIISDYCEYQHINNFKIDKVEKKRKYCISYFIHDLKGFFLIRKRPVEKILGGMYEIPSSSWGNIKNFKSRDFIILKKNYKPISLKKVIKHEFSHFTLFLQVIIVKKEELKKNSFRGRWVNQKSIKEFPISNLTKKVIDYSLEEVFDLRKSL